MERAGAWWRGAAALWFHLALITSASAQPARQGDETGAPPVDARERPHPSCDLWPYFTPSLHLTVVGYAPVPAYLPAQTTADTTLTRVAAGLRLRDCGLDGLEVRAGVTGYYSTLKLAPNYGDMLGGGGELEVGVLVSPDKRASARFSLETAAGSSTLYTAGVRLRLQDIVWVGIDVFHITKPAHDGSVPTTGLQLGVGLSGRPGLYSALAFALFVVYVVESLPTGQG